MSSLGDQLDSPLTRALLAGVGILLLIVLVIAGPEYYVNQRVDPARITQIEKAKQVDANRRTLIQLVGGLFVAIGLYLTYRRTQLTDRRIRVIEDGQITDRFTQAIEQLGDDRMEVRLGGIYALERIAKDSSGDHWTVMETLCAFVRENRRYSPQGEEPKYWGEPLPTDIQAALTVIGRRKVERDPPSSRLDLQDVDLRCADLRGANLQNVILRESNLALVNAEGANLQEGDLTATILREANLSEAVLQGAMLDNVDLKGADLEKAILDKAKCSRANFAGARMWNASMMKITLENTNLSDSSLMGAQLQNARMRRANLEDAGLNETNLRDVDFTGANLCGATMSWADVRGAYFKNANMRTVMMADVDLRGTNFRSADLSKASIINPNLEGARFEGANLGPSGRENLDFCKCASLNSSIDGMVRLPEKVLEDIKDRCPDLLKEREKRE